ncbi:MAG: response regulator [Planctomycetota bacterium]|jgi:CheY-like chemotaxis protein|nr:response regulator [Planctomycetota bacterium]
MRLLLLEDEPAIRSALQRALRKWGYEVAAAASLEEARGLLSAFQPQALVSDLKLPDGSGLDLAKELGAPFILMSGYASFDDAVAALRLGCVDFLTKPVAMKALQRSLLGLTAGDASSELAVFVPAEQSALTAVSASAITSEPLFTKELTWTDREQGEAAFAAAGACADSIQERQVLAELMQAAEVARVVVNHGPQRWRAWLDAAVNWDASAEQRDRRQFIDDLADRALFRPEGVIVECRRDG